MVPANRYTYPIATCAALPELVSDCLDCLGERLVFGGRIRGSINYLVSGIAQVGECTACKAPQTLEHALASANRVDLEGGAISVAASLTKKLKLKSAGI